MENFRKPDSIFDKRFYTTRNRMINRCYNKNSYGYEYYGGRGICVDKKRHSFDMFFIDMYGEYLSAYKIYGKKTSIDRINSNDDYYKENCQRIHISENSRKAGLSKNKKGRFLYTKYKSKGKK